MAILWTYVFEPSFLLLVSSRFPGNNDPSFRKQEMSSKCSDQLGLSDIMGEITFSRSFGFMKRGADDGSLISIEGVLACTAWLGQVPWIYRINEVFRPYIGNNLAVNACNGSLF